MTLTIIQAAALSHVKQHSNHRVVALLNRDYRFSLCTIIFQSVFQGSLYWFRKTAHVVHELECLAALRTPHNQWRTT